MQKQLDMPTFIVKPMLNKRTSIHFLLAPQHDFAPLAHADAAAVDLSSTAAVLAPTQPQSPAAGHLHASPHWPFVHLQSGGHERYGLHHKISRGVIIAAIVTHQRIDSS